MKIRELDELEKLIENSNKRENQMTICKNIKKFRLEHYALYKSKGKKATSSINPYTSENISSLLGFSHVHYKRLESETDPSKYVTIDTIIKLSIIYDKKIDEFLQK